MKLKMFTLIAIFSTIIISCSTNNKTLPFTETPLVEQIGQMVMVGFRGFEIDSVNQTFLAQIDSGYVGSVVLFDYDVVNKEFKRNINSPAQVKKLISDLQARSKTPLFVAVDQEGGRVNRLKQNYGFPASVSAKYLGTINNLDSTRFYAERNALTLHSMGFNVNFAPSVDLDINATNPVIGKIERSFSPDATTVIQHASEWIKAHDAQGILSTLKHFPGHGSSDADSHYGVTDITKYWQELELRPFKVISSAYDVAIMTAHVLNTNLDSVPATLSSEVINGILRDQWNFDGIVFSDDLHMKAVNAMYDFETIIKMSILAGADVLVYGNNLEHDEMIPTKIIHAVSKMVKNGEISPERIKTSYDRIIREKKRLGLIK